MKKTICLILTLMLVMTTMSVFAATDEFLAVEVHIPIVKTITQLGTKDPGKGICHFELGNFDAEVNISSVTGLDLEFDGAGTYQHEIVITLPNVSEFWNLSEGFTVRETNDSVDGWQCDQTVWLVLPEFDRMTRNVTCRFCKWTEKLDPYDENTEFFSEISFTNTYDSNANQVRFSVPIVKKAEQIGATAPSETTFRFSLTSPEPGVVENVEILSNGITVNGSGEFEGTLVFACDPEDLPAIAEHGLILFEVDDGEPGWEYDGTKWFLKPNIAINLRTVNQTSASETELLITRYGGKDDQTFDCAEFVNRFSGDDSQGGEWSISVPVTKTVNGKNAPDATFTFEISDTDAQRYSVEQNQIKTRGEGTYTGVVEINAQDRETYALLLEGFSISEKKMSGWNCDSTKWNVMSDLGDDGVTRFVCFTQEHPATDAVSFVNEYEGTVPSDHLVTLTYDPNGGTLLTSDTETYPQGTTVTPDKVPGRDGHTFTGWYEDKELTKPVAQITLNRDTTLYAGWKTTPVPDQLDGSDHISYVVGYEDNTVRPNADITRAEVTAIFYRLLKPEVRAKYQTETHGFTDVPATEWYNASVATMANLGVVRGRTTTEFEPDASITRAEFAAICARFDTSVASGKSNFTDIKGHWAEGEINRAVILGWIRGYDDGTFRPDNNISRAEAMALVNRVLQRIPESPSDLLSGMLTFPDNSDTSEWYYLTVQEAINAHEFERKENGYEKWTVLK